MRLLADIPAYQSRSKLLGVLDLPRNLTSEVLSFLLEKGLCREEGGRILIGPSRTHLTAHSPYIWNMHKNWRMKAMERHGKADSEELFYSAPMSIAREDVKKIRELLMQTISEMTKIAADSKPETLVGLNIDWFNIAK